MNSSSFPIPSSELTSRQTLGETYLDLMFTTLKESSRIALFLWWPSAYGLDPSNSEAHWKRQNEILVKFMQELAYGGDSLDYEFGPLELLSECLTNELKFQATFEAEVRQFLEDYTPDDDRQRLFASFTFATRPRTSTSISTSQSSVQFSQVESVFRNACVRHDDEVGG